MCPRTIRASLPSNTRLADGVNNRIALTMRFEYVYDFHFETITPLIAKFLPLVNVRRAPFVKRAR